MNGPRLVRGDDGRVMLEDLAPWFVSVLLELPQLLAPEQPEDVHHRLYPAPSADREQQEEWKKFVHPELFSLLASAREIVGRDLGNLGPAPGSTDYDLWRLEIPAAHVPGWISGLNAARLTLGTLHDVEEGDMADEVESEEWEPRQVAVAKIHLLGWIQQLLVEDRNPPPEGDDELYPR